LIDRISSISEIDIDGQSLTHPFTQEILRKICTQRLHEFGPKKVIGKENAIRLSAFVRNETRK
jgi:hypothetical protein